MKKTCDIVKRVLNKYCKLKSAYTLAEVVVVMLVVAVVVSVSIKITKVKLDNIISYTYYSGYSTLRSVTGQVLADFKSTDNVYMDKDISWLRFFSLPAFAKDCFVEIDYGKDGKRCGNYKLVNPCTVMNWNCSAHIGQYGITAELCNHGLAVPYGRYITKGNLDFASGDGITREVLNKLVSSGLLDGKWASYISDGDGYSNTVCTNYWGSGSWNRLNACHDTDLSQECSWTSDHDTYMVIISNEVIEPDPEPDPNVCTTPSEAEQQVHRCQNQEEWKGEPTCGYVPITCPEGNHWSVNSCGCVPESPTLPRKGINFCRKFVSYTNTKSNSPECTGTAISSTETDFSDKTADITLRNGIRIYNMSQNPQEIGILEGNTQGASYDGVPNINTFGYTVYLDIDGEKGSSTLWEDVYKFYITMAGKVIPAYDENNPNEEVGGNSRRHLMTSVERETIVDGRRQMRWLKKSVSFKEGACTSNYLGASSRYCNGVNLLPDCNDPINPCLMKHVSPVKFF